MKETTKGITVTFKEQENSIAGILTAYIKQNPGEVGTEIDQTSLVDKILTNAGISPNIWKVTKMKFTPNTWGVTMKDDKGKKTKVLQAANYQLKVEIYVERIVPQEGSILESYKEIVKDMPAFEPPIIITTKIGNGVAGEVTTFDAHLAKLAWEQETGYRNFDLNIAVEDYKYATDRNLDLMSPHKPEKIFYIIGQDMYHMDNMAGHTTGGDHTLDVDGRITKVHKKAFAVSKDSIIKSSKIAPVEIIWIPGNHDFLASFMLVHSLQQYFRNYSRVTVDLGENPRKARLWGSLLVGWTHSITGKHTVWSNELAQAFPELWGKSKFREWHHGDQHKKMDVKITPVFTSGGVVCRQITALSPVDKWHTDNVFTDAVPGGESFLWSKEVGVFANFMSWTGQYELNRNKIIKTTK